MDQVVLDYISRCKTRPPADPHCIGKLRQRFRCALQGDYLDVLQHANGFEGFVGDNHVSLWPAEHVMDFGVYDAMPYLIFIGSDGAGEGFAFDTRDSSMPIVNVPFIGMEAGLIRVLGHSIREFLEHLATVPLLE